MKKINVDKSSKNVGAVTHTHTHTHTHGVLKNKKIINIESKNIYPYKKTNCKGGCFCSLKRKSGITLM